MLRTILRLINLINLETAFLKTSKGLAFLVEVALALFGWEFIVRLKEK